MSPLFSMIFPLNSFSHRWGSRQFKSTRQTKWERCTRGPLLWRSEHTRSVTPLCLTILGEFRPLWQEVDVTGVVLRVGKPNTKFQAVHLVDHHLNILAVHFWGGLKVRSNDIFISLLYVGSVTAIISTIICFVFSLQHRMQLKAKKWSIRIVKREGHIQLQRPLDAFFFKPLKLKSCCRFWQGKG